MAGDKKNSPVPPNNALEVNQEITEGGISETPNPINLDQKVADISRGISAMKGNISADTVRIREIRQSLGLPDSSDKPPSTIATEASIAHQQDALEEIKERSEIERLREEFKEKYRSLRESAPVFKDPKSQDLGNLNEGTIQANTLPELKILLEIAGLSPDQVFESLNEMNAYATEAQKNGLHVDHFSLVVRREIKQDGATIVFRTPTVKVSRPEHVDKSAFDRVARANDDLFTPEVSGEPTNTPSTEIKELIRKEKRGEVTVNTLTEFRELLLNFGFSEEQTDEILDHENAHASKAMSLGVKVMGYTVKYDLDESDASPAVYLQPAAMMYYEKGQSKFLADITSAPDDLSESDLAKLGISSEKDLEISLADVEKLSRGEKRRRLSEILSTLTYTHTNIINQKLSLRSLREIKEILLLKPELLSGNTVEAKIYRKVERALNVV